MIPLSRDATKREPEIPVIRTARAREFLTAMAKLSINKYIGILVIRE